MSERDAINAMPEPRTPDRHTCAPRLLLPALLIACGLPGCVVRTPRSVTRCWIDYNTLKQPALCIDEIDNLPIHAPRVDHFRWMYNAGPGERMTRFDVLPAAYHPSQSDPQSPPKPPVSKSPTTSLPDGLDVPLPLFDDDDPAPGIDGVVPPPAGMPGAVPPAPSPGDGPTAARRPRFTRTNFVRPHRSRIPSGGRLFEPL